MSSKYGVGTGMLTNTGNSTGAGKHCTPRPWGAVRGSEVLMQCIVGCIIGNCTQIKTDCSNFLCLFERALLMTKQYYSLWVI